MVLLKWCTQYASKFGKLSSGRRSGKGQFSFQSQRKAMPKKAQTTTQLHSFHMLYTAYKLNNQGDNMQPWYTAFWLTPVCCSMSSSNCCFLTCIQISQEAGKVVWYSYLFKNFPQFVVIHTVKGFSTVNEAEVDVFFWNSLVFSMIQWMLAIWLLVPLPFLNQVEHMEVLG